MAKGTDPKQSMVASNRRARHEYEILDTVEAGLVLTGSEVKSLREGHAVIRDGYAYFRDGEAWIENVTIPEYINGTWNNHAPKRKRKLLLHKLQIHKWSAKVAEQGLTVVPLSLYFSDGRAKLELGLARGKKDWDKRQTLRERQDRREAERAMKTRGRDW